MKLKTKNLKSRKIQDQEKYFRIEKKYLRIKKNISEWRKMFQNLEMFCDKTREKNLEFNDFEFNEPPSQHLLV